MFCGFVCCVGVVRVVSVVVLCCVVNVSYHVLSL